jgi:hypothetical protein
VGVVVDVIVIATVVVGTTGAAVVVVDVVGVSVVVVEVVVGVTGVVVVAVVGAAAVVVVVVVVVVVEPTTACALELFIYMFNLFPPPQYSLAFALQAILHPTVPVSIPVILALLGSIELPQ